MAELVDALDLGSSVFDVGVRVPPGVPLTPNSLQAFALTRHAAQSRSIQKTVLRRRKIQARILWILRIHFASRRMTSGGVNYCNSKALPVNA